MERERERRATIVPRGALPIILSCLARRFRFHGYMYIIRRVLSKGHYMRRIGRGRTRIYTVREKEMDWDNRRDSDFFVVIERAACLRRNETSICCCFSSGFSTDFRSYPHNSSVNLVIFFY